MTVDPAQITLSDFPLHKGSPMHKGGPVQRPRIDPRPEIGGPVHKSDTPQETAKEGEDNSLSFGDFLDAINPLHHIPVVSTVYRQITGDEISPAAKVLGGGIFGGLIGAIGAVADSIIEQVSGRDIGENVVAMFVDEGEEETAPPVLVAQQSVSPILPEHNSEEINQAELDLVAGQLAAIMPASGNPGRASLSPAKPPVMTAQDDLQLITKSAYQDRYNQMLSVLADTKAGRELSEKPVRIEELNNIQYW